MRANPLIIALSVFCVIVLSASTVSAQFFGTSEKPFSNLQKPPTVSPYLSLFLDEGISTYHSLVQPQLRQQRFNQSQVRENQKQQRFAARQQLQLQSLSVRARVQDQAQLRPTGRGDMSVSSRFMNFGSFFGGR